MPVGAPLRVAQDFEDRERPAEQRIHAARGLDHHELSRPREAGDLRRVERQHAVVVGEPRVRQDHGVDVARHSPKYTLRVMRFLRMLTNSLLAGALGAAFLTIIVLQLNPSVPLLSARRGGSSSRSALFYGVHLAVRVLPADGRTRVHRPRRAVARLGSVRILAWLTAASRPVASVLMWLNVTGFAAALGESAARRMTAGAAATTATAIVLLGLAAAHYSFGRRGSRVGAALLAIAVFGSLALPVAARGPGGRGACRRCRHRCRRRPPCRCRARAS